MKKVSLSFVGTLFTLGIAGTFTITGCSPSNPNMADPNRNANNLSRDYRVFNSSNLREYNINENSKGFSHTDVEKVRAGNTNDISKEMSDFLGSSSAVAEEELAAVINASALVRQDDDQETPPAQDRTESADAAGDDPETPPAQNGTEPVVADDDDQETPPADSNYFVSYEPVDESSVLPVESRKFKVNRDENDKITSLTVDYGDGSEVLTYTFANQLKTTDEHVLVISDEDMTALKDGHDNANVVTVLRYVENSDSDQEMSKTDNKIEAELHIFNSKSLKDAMEKAKTESSDSSNGDGVEQIINTEDLKNALESRFLINTGPVVHVSTNCADRGPSREIICELDRAAEDRAAYVTIAQAVWLSNSVDNVKKDRADNSDNFNISKHLGYSGNMDIELNYKTETADETDTIGKLVNLSYQSEKQDRPSDYSGDFNVAQATRDDFWGTTETSSQEKVTVPYYYNIHEKGNFYLQTPYHQVFLLERQINGNDLYLELRFPTENPHKSPVLVTLQRFEDVANRTTAEGEGTAEGGEGDGTAEGGEGEGTAEGGEGDGTAEGGEGEGTAEGGEGEGTAEGGEGEGTAEGGEGEGTAEDEKGDNEPQV